MRHSLLGQVINWAGWFLRTAGGKRFYIDPAGNNGNDGSAEFPWLTLNFACTQVLTPGDTIHINAGVYNEPNRCVLAVGVNIEGVGDASHIISTYVGGAVDDASIYLNSAVEGTPGNQSISYIKLDGSSLTALKGILIRLRSNVCVHHCTIVDFNYGAVTFDGAIILRGIVIYSTSNKLYNCTITNCSTRSAPQKEGHLIISGQQSMRIYNNTFTQNSRVAGENGNIIDGVDGEFKDVKIYNNIFTKAVDSAGVWDFHIELWNVYGGMEIYDNEFYEGYQCIDTGGFGNVKGDYDYSLWIHDNYFELAVPLAGQGPRLKMAIDIEGNNKDVIINNNHIKNFPFGVYLVMPAFVGPPNLMERIHVNYNIFENIGYSAGTDFCAAIYISASLVGNQIQDIYIYNNVMDIGFFAYTGVHIYYSCPIDRVYIRNNTIQDSFFGPIVFDNGGDNLDVVFVQNNCYFNNGNADNITYLGVNNVTNLTESDNLKDNPDFVGGGNYHLTAPSPCINNGLNVGLTNDYDDVPVSDPPEIGAYEYIS